MPDKPINIIFIHRGQADYLRFSLAGARRSNPTANIILLDDGSNGPFDSIKRYNIDDYSGGAEEFARVYQHFSSNPEWYELFCLQRWFIIADFVKKNGLENFFHADSDVLIFADLAKEWPKFSQFALTLSEGSAGHNSFWNSPEILDDFCRFLTDVYSRKDEAGYQRVVDFWKNYQLKNKPGGICDMTMLNFYKKSRPELVGETAGIIDGSTYDDNFSSSIQGGVHYQMSVWGAKKIYWRSGAPYGKDDSGNLIKFNTLHLQGKKKKYLERAYQGKNIYAWETFIKGKIISLIKKAGLFEFYTKLKRIFKKDI
ncbi:MAG: hypothetical protein PHE24_03100 [Patescibacteria group bacterium]|nr:hypothetical protein [Patescibacteria group bacterium]